MLGLVPMALAVPLALSAERPEILVHPDGTSAAIRVADGRFRIVAPKADRFAAEYWLRADADPRLPEDPSLADGIACDDDGCVVALGDGARVALGANAGALADDCARAQVVVTACCPAGAPGRRWSSTARRYAAVAPTALYRTEGEGDQPTFRVETAYPQDGPRRPFMPPAQ